MGSIPKIIAVDPGLSGAVVYYRPDTHELKVHRDFKRVKDIAESTCVGKDITNRPCRAIIELVGSRPGQGIVSTSHFMIAYGVAMGSIQSSLYREEITPPVFNVHPARWQNWVRREFSIYDDTKRLCDSELFKPDYVNFDSRVYAVNLFPDSVSLFRRAKDHNTADAVLLAVYCYWFGREEALIYHLSQIYAFRNGHRDSMPILDFVNMGFTGLDKFYAIIDDAYQI